MIGAIFLIILGWTILSVGHTLYNLGNKCGYYKTNIHKYFDYAVNLPVLIIACLFGTISYLCTKPDEPLIIHTTAETVRAPKYHVTQIRIKGKWNRYWTINVYSDDETITKVF